MTHLIKTAEGIEAPTSETTTETIPERTLLRTIDDWQTFEVKVSVDDFWAEDSNLYKTFYEPNVRCFLLEARARHGANGGANAAVTVEKLSNGTAMGSGLSMLKGLFTFTSSANTTQKQGATTVLSAVQLTPGDAMALRPSGTLTNLRDVTVTCVMGILMKDLPSGESTTAVLVGLG